ncbi:MAG: hypothetical protein RIK87_00385 [Fuerstiella sp.]
MLRKGIVALMIGVMSVGTIQAEDAQKSSRLVEFLRGPQIGRPSHRTGTPARTSAQADGIRHAVVADAEKQVPEIRQTSSRPEPPQLQPADTAPQPTPVEYAAGAPPRFPTVTPQAVGYPTYPAGYGPQVMAWPAGNGPYQFASSAAYSGGAVHPGHPAPGPYTAHTGGGALYPAPQPGIPAGIGGTSIVTDALHPHEMLYPHRYKAMYGPYYYKVNGCWVVTPFGVWSNENWKLQGTTVDVKYKSHISPFAMFRPPVLR